MSAAEADVGSAEFPVQDFLGRPAFRFGGTWAYQMPVDSRWLPGQWLRVTDPGENARRDEYHIMSAPTSALCDGIGDLGRVMIPGYYADGYPWEAGAPEQLSGCSVAQDGRDVLATFGRYTAAGAKWRDAIRHAEIVGHAVPASAYDRLRAERRGVPT